MAILIRLFSKNRPDYLIADGFLIGDCVLLRPLCKAIEAKSSNSYYMGGTHSKFLLEDIQLKIIENQFPWATYNYSYKNLCKQLKVWFKIFLLQPHTIIETRGDLRSILFLYMACPKKLVGYSFTGGKTFLDVEPEDDGKIDSLGKHVERLTIALGLEYVSESIRHKQIFIKPKRIPEIGLSFSGSQVLKTMPFQVAKKLLEILSDIPLKLSYLSFKKDFFFKANQELLKGFNINIVPEKNFQGYLDILKTLDGYIGMDSSGGHICSIYQVPCMIFFGTFSAEYAQPIGNPYFIPIETNKDYFCRPCNGSNCHNIKYQSCLNDISQIVLEEKIQDFIKMINDRKSYYKP
ncbi:MAG: hypothetical protein H7A23_25620 [Leptospiraceae bacterium]|nr:hypothetical protein [Leptospiraceae bacterium]MCP5497947.1 hypothetical protein [Leptospiraceae bacterium]